MLPDSILLSFASLIVTLKLIEGKACDTAYPNRTNEALHWYSCSGPNDAFHVHRITLLDLNNSLHYPIEASRGFVTDVASTNQSPKTYTSLLVDAKLYYWGRSFFGYGSCRWRRIPTLGLTSNLDGCDLGKNCPVEPGRGSFKQTMSFGAFSVILDSLGGNTVYQMEMRTKNGDSDEHEQLACVRVQGYMK